MSRYQFILEPYRGRISRYNCPRCQKKHEFTRYINVETKEYVAPHVGKCNRDIKCGYHYTPKQFFNDNGIVLEKTTTSQTIPQRKDSNVFSSIPPKYAVKSFGNYKKNNLLLFIENRFGKKITNQIIDRFKIGTSDKKTGATIFWQIDETETIRTGKIIFYNKDTGKRSKAFHSHISWVHNYINSENYELSQCLFGLHQLKESSNNKTIAIVESEKTAIIASIYFPEYTWMATGGLSNLSLEKIKPLRDRRVILFPDVGAFNRWKVKRDLICEDLDMIIEISDFLESNANATERLDGYDLADYLLELSDDYIRRKKLGQPIEIMKAKSSAFVYLIEKLCLEEAISS